MWWERGWEVKGWIRCRESVMEIGMHDNLEWGRLQDVYEGDSS